MLSFDILTSTYFACFGNCTICTEEEHHDALGWSLLKQNVTGPTGISSLHKMSDLFKFVLPFSKKDLVINHYSDIKLAAKPATGSK